MLYISICIPLCISRLIFLNKFVCLFIPFQGGGAARQVPYSWEAQPDGQGAQGHQDLHTDGCQYQAQEALLRLLGL